jgi:hypothetical protein
MLKPRIPVGKKLLRKIVRDGSKHTDPHGEVSYLLSNINQGQPQGPNVAIFGKRRSRSIRLTFWKKQIYSAMKNELDLSVKKQNN